MLADLDLLLISVFCTADDLLPQRPQNARRSLNDAEVVTLCVAQSIMGIPSDERFVKTAARRLGHLFPALTSRSGFHKRRDRLADTIDADGHLRKPKPRLAGRRAARRFHPGGMRPTVGGIELGLFGVVIHGVRIVSARLAGFFSAQRMQPCHGFHDSAPEAVGEEASSISTRAARSVRTSSLTLATSLLPRRPRKRREPAAGAGSPQCPELDSNQRPSP